MKEKKSEKIKDEINTAFNALPESTKTQIGGLSDFIKYNALTLKLAGSPVVPAKIFLEKQIEIANKNPQQYVENAVNYYADKIGNQEALYLDPTVIKFPNRDQALKDGLIGALNYAKQNNLPYEQYNKNAANILDESYKKYANYTLNLVAERNAQNESFGDFLKQAALMVAPFVIPGVGATLGSILAPTAAAGTQAIIGNAIIQGTLAEAQGGDFLKGAALSVASSALPSVNSSIGEALGGGTAANVAAGALTSGALADLAGGDFKQGALMGGINAGINEAKLGLAEDYINSVEPGIGYDDLTSPTELDVIAAYPDLAPPPVFDTSFTPDYSLATGAPVIPDMGGQGIQVPTITELVDVVSQPVDYSLPIPDSGFGLVMPTAPNLIEMGGGKGITAPAIELPAYVAPDTSFTPDYGLNFGAPVIPEMGAQGIQVPEINEIIDVLSNPVDYSLPVPDSGLGLVMPTAPNLDSMGGGQGLVIPVDGGVITEAGFIPETYVPDLGDPNSFINQPAPNVEVNIPELPAEQPKDISGELAALDLVKALAPIAVTAALAKDQPQATTDEQTGYPILPIPSEWKAPEYSMAFTPSAPVDFGSPDLLRGTQWANAAAQPRQMDYTLSDVINTLNYQSVPFVQQQMQPIEQSYSVPDILQQFQTKSTVGMNDIIGGLNGRQVSISDIISGIQSQYG